MHPFPAAIQRYAFALRRGESPDAVLAALRDAAERAESATQSQATWAARSLLDDLVSLRASYRGMTALLVERCLAAGADAWAVTGPLVEALAFALTAGKRFHEDSQAALRAANTDGVPADEAAFAVLRAAAEKSPEAAFAWAELEPLAQACLGVLRSFAEARALLRRAGVTPAALAEVVPLAPGVADVAEILAASDESDLPPGHPDAVIAGALAALRASLEGGEANIVHEIQGVIHSLFSVETTRRDAALHQLARLAEAAPAAHAGDLMQTCATLVETGGDATISGGAILSRLPDLLRGAEAFRSAAFAAASAAGVDVSVEDVADIIDRFGTDLVATMPDGAHAWHGLDAACSAAVVHLSRSSSLRASARRRPDLRELVVPLARVSDGASSLSKMLDVLDGEELVVLAPAHRLGFRVRVSGVGDIFQLHTLIAATVFGSPRNGRFPGPLGPNDLVGDPLDPLTAGAALDLPCTGRDRTIVSRAQLSAFTGLDSDAPERHHLDHDATPADIPALDGRRIILLGVAHVRRSWTGGRPFPLMRAVCELVGELTPDDVDEHLESIRRHARPR